MVYKLLVRIKLGELDKVVLLFSLDNMPENG